MNTASIASIVIGERVRKDMGDVESLAESMKRHGLLHPVVVKTDMTLVAGHRRIEAALLLGWKEIPVTVIEVEDLLSAESDENGERKDFTPTEAVAIGKLIEEQEKPKAEQRKREGSARGGSKAGPVQIPAPSTRDVAGRAVGMSGSTYARAKAVIAAADSDPERFGDLPSRMDETGNVMGAHNELKRRKGASGSNGKKLRHAAFKKMHYPKPNREMQRAVDSLDGICICLRELPIKQLDAGKTKAWAVALKKCASTITRVAREVERVKAD